MAPRRAYHELPSSAVHGRGTAFYGMLLFVVIEGTAVISTLTSYFYLGVMSERWPPPSVPPPDLTLPTVGTSAIVLSALLALYVDRRLLTKPEKLRQLVPVSLALVLLYVGTSLFTLYQRTYTWADHAYGSISWLSDGTSLLHVSALLGIGGFVLATSWADPEANLPKVRVLALYWTFAALTAAATWGTLYLFPAVLGGLP